MTWGFWVIGGLVLVGAGFAAGLVPRRRVVSEHRRVAWSAARTAIETAAVSRDAAPTPVPEAERLLTRAELVAARRGGVAAAGSAAELARRADRLWRAAAGE
jgi:hypothetical protein